MNVVSICNSEAYYHIKNNVNKEINKNVVIKKNTISKNTKLKKNKVKRVLFKDYDINNKINKEDNYIGKEEEQLEFELSLDVIENSFTKDSLDLFKHSQIENNEDYKPSLYEEEQLSFDLTMEEIEDSFIEISLDLFLHNQLDCDVNDINVEAQAYENIVELEFEYSDED